MTDSPLVRRAVAADMADLVAFEPADPTDLHVRAENFVRDGFGEVTTSRIRPAPDRRAGAASPRTGNPIR